MKNSCDPSIDRYWDQARVLDASDRDYLETVLALLDGAEKEIVIAFYLIEPSDKAGATHSVPIPINPSNAEIGAVPTTFDEKKIKVGAVNRLLEGLLRARKREVSVRLLLNTNFRFSPKTEVANGPWFERMTQAGIQITALLPSRRLHDKLIVIDGRYVVDGSMNWSMAALMSNFESAGSVS